MRNLKRDFREYRKPEDPIVRRFVQPFRERFLVIEEGSVSCVGLFIRVMCELCELFMCFLSHL